jgi:hypothetical protein
MATLLGAQNHVTYQYRGSVTAAVTFTRNLGGAIGVTSLGLLFNFLTREPLSHMGGHFSTSELLDRDKLVKIGEQYPAELKAGQGAIVHGLLWVFAAMIIPPCAQVLISLALPAREKPDHKPTPAESLEAVTG